MQMAGGRTGIQPWTLWQWADLGSRTLAAGLPHRTGYHPVPLIPRAWCVLMTFKPQPFLTWVFTTSLVWKNPMGRGAWWAIVHGVAKSRTRLSDFTFTFHFPALVKEMASHSSVLAWRIPGMGEPGGLPSMGSHRVGHNWSNLAAAAAVAAFPYHAEEIARKSLRKTSTSEMNWE